MGARASGEAPWETLMTALPTDDFAGSFTDIADFTDIEDHGVASAKPGRLGAGLLAVFAGPSLPISALGLPLAVYLPEFFANVIGVGLGLVGSIFLGVRLLDLIVDPVLGGLMDGTRTPIGRFRPWMLVGAPVVMLATYMTFMAQPGAGAVHLGAWLLALYLGYSILTLSHTAWASTLAEGYHERSRIYAWMQAGLVLSMVMVPAIYDIGRRQSALPGAGVHAIGWFIITLAPITVALASLFVPETTPKVRHADGRSLRDFVRLAMRPSVARILLADLCLAFGPSITAALFFFYFREARGFTTGEANILLLAYFIGALFGAPIWTRLAKSLGKHRALICAAAFYVTLQLALLITPKGSLTLGLLLLWVAGLAYSAPTIFIRAMLADAADEANLDMGRESTGMLYAMISSTAKISSALAIFITYRILSMVGFAPKAYAHNTPHAIDGLAAVFIGGPVVFASIGAAILWSYRLDEGRHAEIRAALDARGDG